MDASYAAAPTKCPSCGAPMAPTPGAAVITCEYCGNHVRVPCAIPSPPQTIIINARHIHNHRHRLRRLIEAAAKAGNANDDREPVIGY